ncbi:MAG TPA: hypothetical protein VKR78_07585 [Acidimicrobiales bacterium]|nr:hypothetical protein [Acidimicrobiales bacterium]
MWLPFLFVAAGVLAVVAMAPKALAAPAPSGVPPFTSGFGGTAPGGGGGTTPSTGSDPPLTFPASPYSFDVGGYMGGLSPANIGGQVQFIVSYSASDSPNGTSASGWVVMNITSIGPSTVTGTVSPNNTPSPDTGYSAGQTVTVPQSSLAPIGASMSTGAPLLMRLADYGERDNTGGQATLNHAPVTSGGPRGALRLADYGETDLYGRPYYRDVQGNPYYCPSGPRG